jgi:hypothetical protein
MTNILKQEKKIGFQKENLMKQTKENFLVEKKKEFV